MASDEPLGLRHWDQLKDAFDPEKLAKNFRQLDRHPQPVASEGIACLREDDQHFIETLAEWLYEPEPKKGVRQDVLRDGEEWRHALLIFSMFNHARVVIDEVRWLFDLRPRGRSMSGSRDFPDYVAPDGTILAWITHDPRRICGRFHDAIFIHPTVQDPECRLAAEPATPRLYA